MFKNASVLGNQKAAEMIAVKTVGEGNPTQLRSFPNTTIYFQTQASIPKQKHPFPNTSIMLLQTNHQALWTATPSQLAS